MRHDAHVPDTALFGSCDHRERRAIAKLGTPILIDEGRTLITEGERGREFFVVGSGCAVCEVGRRAVARFGMGDFFGEMALLDGGPRTATVTAESQMLVWVYSTAEFRALLDTSPRVRERLFVELAHRLRAANAA